MCSSKSEMRLLAADAPMMLLSDGERPWVGKNLPPDNGRQLIVASANSRRVVKWPRVLIRPEPGFYLMRLVRGRPLAPAPIFQPLPMVITPTTTLHWAQTPHWLP